MTYADTMDLKSIELTKIDGTRTTYGEYADNVVLVVNVASRCGFTPHYEQLEQLQEQYGERGFTVLGFPSNQFMQELKNNDDIADYCSLTWGVTFPMFEKTKVNGKNRHPLFAALADAPDDSGKAGNVKWNFEKFLVLPNGEMHRFRSTVKPDAPEIVALIEANLPR
jgi:glutathione peroxidase